METAHDQRDIGMDRLPFGGLRNGERNVGDGRYADLLEQVSSLLDIDAKGRIAPHGIGGLARELLCKCASAIEDLSRTNAVYWEIMTLPDVEVRQWFIGDLIRKNRHFNRADICKAFKVSVPQASADIKRWIASNPNRITYNVSAKRYELAA